VIVDDKMDTGHLAQCLYAVIWLPDDTRTESTAEVTFLIQSAQQLPEQTAAASPTNWWKRSKIPC
jgi:hypothetical protein